MRMKSMLGHTCAYSSACKQSIGSWKWRVGGVSLAIWVKLIHMPCCLTMRCMLKYPTQSKDWVALLLWLLNNVFKTKFICYGTIMDHCDMGRSYGLTIEAFLFRCHSYSVVFLRVPPKPCVSIRSILFMMSRAKTGSKNHIEPANEGLDQLTSHA